MEPKLRPFLRAAGIATALMAVTGCASHDSAATSSPETTYEEYLALTQKDTPLRLLADRWDREAREMFLRTSDSSGESIPIEVFESSLRYPLLFAEAPASPQAIEATPESSCLLLIGPAADGGSLALSVLLKKHRYAWLHSELFARYLDPATPQPEHPSCNAPESFQD
ncbi:hypothetical protein [Marinobacter sp.]|uniref:hypothetical protein n=1 Tax=Marinobacter sp. TaxID=50741 RepID=UPI00356A05A5